MSSASSSSATGARKIPLRMGPESFLDKRYTLSTFYRSVNFTEEFPAHRRTLLRRRTIEDVQKHIEEGVDTDTKQIRERRQLEELKRSKRRKQEEEYLIKEHEERERRKAMEEAAREEAEAAGGGASSSSSSASPTNASASPEAKQEQQQQQQQQRKSRTNRQKWSGRRRRKKLVTYILEDEEQSKSFQGVGEETHENKYFLFVMDGGQMRVLPVEQKWIHFKSIAAASSTSPASLEEVEKRIKEEIQSKQKQEDLFTQKYHVKAEEEALAARRPSRASIRDRANEEVDFNEFFDDDEAPTVEVREVHDGYVELPEEDVEADKDESERRERERQRASELAEDTEDEVQAGDYSRMKELLMKLERDPESLETAEEEKKKKEQENEIPTKSGAKSKKRKEPAATGASKQVAEATIPTLSEGPASKRQKTTATAAVSSVSITSTDVINFIKSKGGRASLSDVRKHFIPSSKNMTKAEQKRRVTMLSEALKAVARAEKVNGMNYLVLKPEFAK